MLKFSHLEAEDADEIALRRDEPRGGRELG
jgi:hypothetical protein